METLEDLVVGVAADFQPSIYESFMEGGVDAYERDRLRTDRFEDGFQAVELFLLLSEDVYLVTFFDVLLNVLREKIKLLMEDRLRQGVEGDLRVRREGALLGDLDGF